MRLRAWRQAMGLARAALWLGSGIACDPKAGFESTAGAIDPNEKSYVDGPGSRLVAGPFDTVGIDLDFDTQVHLLARRRDDLGASMTLFGPDAQSGCTIAPNAATWFATRPATKPYRLLPFLGSRGADGTGTLHFSSIDCAIEPYSLDNVFGPSAPELDRGFLVQQGGGLVLADPWGATTTPIVNDLRRLIAIGSEFLVLGDSKVIAFDRDLRELGRFGNNVRSLTDLNFGGSYAVEDDDGLHVLTLNWDTQDFAFDLVDADACALSTSSAYLGWILVHSPCSDDHLLAESINSTSPMPPDRLPFAAEADSRWAKIERFANSSPSLPMDLVAYYLTDYDATTGLGTLLAATPEGEPVQVGTNAALERAFLLEKGPTWAGVALVDVQAGLGRLVRWSWDGTRETLAENVDRAANGPGLLANFDGHAGDLLSLDVHGNASVEQSGAPPFNTTIWSSDFSWALRLEHFDGVTGDLMLAQGLSADYARVARRVAPNQYQFTTIVPLPGFAYIGNYDEQSLTGTLFVQNLTLGVTLTVASQVSDFVATNYPLPGILYSVPVGQNAGIWFARAK